MNVRDEIQSRRPSQDAQRCPRADAIVGERAVQIVEALDHQVVEGDEQIAIADAGAVRGTTFLH